MCVPDYGWSYHPKHVEQFTRNKLCNVASCWKYIKRISKTHRPLNVKKEVKESVWHSVTLQQILHSNTYFLIPLKPSSYLRTTRLKNMCPWSAIVDHTVLRTDLVAAPGARMYVCWVLCYLVEVSVTGRSPVQRIPTECGVSEWSLNVKNEEFQAH